MLSTIEKRLTLPYKKSKLSIDIRTLCQEAAVSLKELHSFIVEARKDSLVREELGTALRRSVTTRFLTRFDMVSNYLTSAERISEAFTKLKLSTLANQHKELLEKHQPIFEAYVRVVQHVNKFIYKLEV
jgi:hypothetical protein